MSRKYVRYLIGSLFFFLVTLPFVDTFAAKQARFSLEFLPPVKTPLGKSRVLIALDMNDRGQVVGRGVGAFGTRAGFLYTPGQGMKYIDPSGLFSVYPWRLNNNGQVLGRDEGRPRYFAFLYDPANGYKSLREGLITINTLRFGFVDFNDAGVILASAAPKANGRVYPYRYTVERGWEDLANDIPALRKFRKNGFSATYINDNGDFTFYRNESDGLHTYVYYAKSDTVVDLSPIFYVGNINNSGQVAGTEYEFTEPLQARPYLYTPGLGLRNIQPPVNGQAGAWWISADGTAGGCVERDGYCQSLFTYHKDRGHKIVDEAKFRAMLPSNMPFAGLSVVSMNDRKEFVGSVLTKDATGSETPARWFIYSPRYGLQDLQKLVNQVRANLKIASIVDINNRGQILLEVKKHGQSVVILTPSK